MKSEDKTVIVTYYKMKNNCEKKILNYNIKLIKTRLSKRFQNCVKMLIFECFMQSFLEPYDL